MKVIAKVTVGSHLYGTALPTSDTDLKEVYIPDIDDILLQNADKITRNNNVDDLDIERLPLHRYIQLLMEGQTSAHDMLFAPDNMVHDATDDWHKLVEVGRKHFISKNVTKMVGFCKAQAYMYCVKAERMKVAQTIHDILLPYSKRDPDCKGSPPLKIKDCEIDITKSPKEHISFEEIIHKDGTGRKEKYLKVCGKMISENDSIEQAVKIIKNILSKYGKRVKKAANMEYNDWKALMHAVRVAEEARELLRDKKITFPRPNADFLLQIKTGKIKFYVIDTIITTTISQIEGLMKTSNLPDKPMSTLAQKFVTDIYRREINNAKEEK